MHSKQPNDQRSTTFTKAETKTRTVARVYSPYYAIRDDAQRDPLPKPEAMPRIGTARFIEAESDVKAVARVLSPTHAT
jgi:hypothetical protein